jgi:hypothetical protein
VSAPQFTSGPWFVQLEQNPTTPSSGRSETLAVHDGHGERIALPARLEDARLIAAAPELYEELLAARGTLFHADAIARSMLTSDPVHNVHANALIETIGSRIAAVDAALAKARGEAA